MPRKIFYEITCKTYLILSSNTFFSFYVDSNVTIIINYILSCTMRKQNIRTTGNGILTYYLVHAQVLVVQ